MRRREFLYASTVGLAGAAIPSIANSVPCPPPTVDLEGTETSSGCVSSIAPPYIASMSAFQIRLMSGPYAPTNGNGTTIDAVTQALAPAWSGTTAGIFRYSGGYKDTNGTTLKVRGGGHNDSANNGCYQFDYSGTNAPRGWTIRQQSSTGAVTDCGTTYSDGRPPSIHSYESLIVANHNGRCYQFGQTGNCSSGNGSSACWMWDAGNDTDNAVSRWSSLPPNIAGGGERTTIYDPVDRYGSSTQGTGNILVSSMANLSTTIDEPYFFRTSNNTWSAQKPAGGVWTPDACGAWDYTRGRALFVRSGTTYLCNVNFVNETVTRSDVNLGLGTSGAPSAFYDPVADRFWAFGGSASSWGTLYEIHPTTLAVTAHSFLGDGATTGTLNSPTSVSSANPSGSFGRFVFNPGWRMVGSVGSPSVPPFVIRLP